MMLRFQRRNLTASILCVIRQLRSLCEGPRKWLDEDENANLKSIKGKNLCTTRAPGVADNKIKYNFLQLNDFQSGNGWQDNKLNNTLCNDE